MDDGVVGRERIGGDGRAVSWSLSRGTIDSSYKLPEHLAQVELTRCYF